MPCYITQVMGARAGTYPEHGPQLTLGDPSGPALSRRLAAVAVPSVDFGARNLNHTLPFFRLAFDAGSQLLRCFHHRQDAHADKSVVHLGRAQHGGQQVVGPRSPRISEPSGGAVVDTECRARLAELIAALQTHGLISN